WQPTTYPITVVLCLVPTNIYHRLILFAPIWVHVFGGWHGFLSGTDELFKVANSDFGSTDQKRIFNVDRVSGLFLRGTIVVRGNTAHSKGACWDQDILRSILLIDIDVRNCCIREFNWRLFRSGKLS